jgi:hypothetical protein
MLTGLMGMGELIWTQTREGEDLAALNAGYDKQFILSNLNYLRSKCMDWYSGTDPDLIEKDRDTI